MENVGKEYEKVASDVQHKFDAQQQEIKNLSIVVLETQKAMQTNADTLHSLLTGMENLGENVRSMQEDMISWQQDYHNEEEQFQELQDQLLQEVPLVDTERVQNKGTIPPIVSTPLTTPSAMPAIVEESAVQTEGVMPPVRENNESGPGEGQSKIPQFFNATGSKGINLVQYSEAGPVPWPKWAPESVKVTPRRTISIPVKPQGAVRETSERQGVGSVTGNPSGTTEEIIDLRTETSTTSQSRSQPTVGNTSIMMEEARRIKEMVQDTIREQFALGRAALRSNLGLPAQELKTIGDRAKEENILNAGLILSLGQLQKNAPSTAPVGNPVPRSSFGSPLPVQNASPSGTSCPSGSQPFATAVWKPKEPPCFFGRNTEDAHTWVSLVRNYLTFMSSSDAQQVAYTATLFRESAHEWYMAHERRNKGPPRDWSSLVAVLLDRFGSNIRSQEAQSQLMSISQGSRPVREYASQFETLLGRLESYDEGLMLNQFVWGLQPDLVRSVSLHYPNSIAKAVLLAETTELAVKASRRPGWNKSTVGNPAKGPNQSNQGQCCALCPGVVDWHNCGNVLGALEFGWGLVCTI